MVRRIPRTHRNPIVAICPNCKSGSKLLRATIPQIDSCGFESYFFQCETCTNSLAGIIDPMNDKLLVSLLEPRGRFEHSSQEKVDYQREALISCAENSLLMILVSKRRS